MTTKHLLAVGALLCAAPARSVETDCDVAGEVFTVDPVAQTMLVRDDRGYLKAVDVDEQTTLTYGVAPHSPLKLWNVNSGDLICADMREDGQRLAKRVIDVPRSELQSRQHGWLTKWNNSLVRGKLQRVLTNPDKVVVDTGGSLAEVTVVPGTAIRLYPATAKSLEDAHEGSLSDLTSGTLLSLRVSADPATGSLIAGSIYTGGVTSVAGTITRIEVLKRTVSIRELGTGRVFELKVSASRLYRALPPIVKSPERHSPGYVLAARHQLVNVGLTDIEIGDWVLVTGMPGSDPGTMSAFAMITRFGYLDSEPTAAAEPPLRF